MAIHLLVVRDDSSSTMNPTMASLLIALLVLAVLACLLVGALVVIRHLRKSRKQADQLPMYNEKRQSRISNPRRLTITATRPESVYVYEEKRNLMGNSSSPPTSPIPEIRITFPEEVDDAGKRLSGRVVVVRVGEQSIGLEPLQEDLPPYQADENDRFQSLDLDRMGGLKEKDLDRDLEKDPRWS